MGSPYFGSTGGSSPYFNGGSGGSVQGRTAAPAKSGGGGFLGAIGHALKQGAIDAKNVAYHAPGGVYDIGKALALDEADMIRGRNATRTLNLAEGTGKQVKSDLTHPLRHPGYTLLDVLPFANSAAKVAEAGRVAAAGGEAGDVGRALVKRPVYPKRTLTRGNAKVDVGSSQSALGAASQRIADKAIQSRAAAKPGGVADKLLLRKMGKAVTAEANTIQNVHRANGAALIALGRKLSPAEQKALQVVAEEAPLHQRITAASARVTGARSRLSRVGHQAELDLLHQAKPLLAGTEGKPAFADAHAAKLGHVLDRMRQVAGSREDLLKGLGQLTDEAAQGRKSKAARVAIGQPVENAAETPPAIPGQLAAFEEPKAPLFEASPEAVRIPDVATRKGARALGRQGQVGGQGSVGHLRAPGSTTHAYTGALREQGLRRQDTTRLVGESGMEAAKFAGLKHVHELVRTAVAPEPTSASDVAVRLDELKPHERMPLEVQRFLADPEEFFHTASPAEQASAFEGVRQRLFVNPKTLDAHASAEFQQLHAQGKIGFVPKQLLGDLAKPHIPLHNPAVPTVDAVNNASRFAILYLKPAYALPNVLGNAALNVLQQGFAAVPNLARAARLNATLGPELTARVDTLMGEGFARAISAHGQGLGRTVVDKAASVWSKGVDTPFRRSAFLYEARRAGYNSPAKLDRLLTAPEHTQKLVEISQRANREIIDYANLSPAEREVIRRVVFFYPWVKGSTMYAGRFLREHPVKAAAVGQTGALGKKTDLQTPSYLEGAFDVGGKLVNPTSTSILQTPAQVGQALAGLAGGNVGEVGQLSNFASPAVALALAAATRRDRGGYPYKPGTNLGGIALDQLVKQLPQYTLGQRISDSLHHKGQEHLYPPNVRDALLQYVVGGVAPRKYNRSKLAELAANEKSRYVP